MEWSLLQYICSHLQPLSLPAEATYCEYGTAAGHRNRALRMILRVCGYVGVPYYTAQSRPPPFLSLVGGCVASNHNTVFETSTTTDIIFSPPFPSVLTESPTSICGRPLGTKVSKIFGQTVGQNEVLANTEPSSVLTKRLSEDF